MYAHASMNRIFRLVWSARLGTWVAVAENAKGRGKGSVRRKLLALALALAALGPSRAGAAHVGAPAADIKLLPTGFAPTVVGKVLNPVTDVAGKVMTITQTTARAAIDWQTFNVAKDARVEFVQPDRTSVTLNRVLDAQPSQILGQIQANGQIFLSNPNGVYFGKSASVDVGGLVASTHSLALDDFKAGKNDFAQAGVTGAVLNDGTLRAALGGYIALLAPEVRNNGVIVAQAGTVALAAGQGFKLKFDHRHGLADVIVEAGHIAALVENGNAVLAPDGLVILSAQAGRQLQGAVVNSGHIEANGLSTDGGRIMLRASERITHSGVISADGGERGTGGKVTLIADLNNMDGVTASSGRISVRGGRHGGDGGLIETSAASVAVAPEGIDASAAHGRLGTWLIDPKDFTVAASGGDMTGAALGDALGRASVELQSSQGKGDNGGSGNIHINDTVNWGTDSVLTLTATHDVNVNAKMTATGANAGLVINPNTASGGAFVLGKDGQINLPRVSATSQTALIIDHKIYTVINKLGVEGSKTGTDLQGIRQDLKGYYALGSDLDAAVASTWNGNKGFDPLGQDSAAAFAGQLDGLGHHITGLVVKRKEQTGVGLFGYTSASAVIRNIALQGAAIEGNASTGALVGVNLGSISNSSARGTVESNGSFGGGLVGNNAGVIRNSSADVTMTSNGSFFGKLDSFGGLVGFNSATISDSGATGDVICIAHTTNSCGGLVGWSTGAVGASYASGKVRGSAYIGGLIGYSGAEDGNKDHTVSGSYATGSATATEYAGGLIGYSTGRGSISDSYAEGTVRAGAYIGGLIGYIEKSSVTNTYAGGKVETGNFLATPRALIGEARDVKFASNYWDTSANPDLNVGKGVNPADATGLDGAAMQNKARFAGFNFGSTWRLRAARKDLAPCLAAFANCVATPIAVKLRPSQSTSVYGEDVGTVRTALYNGGTELKSADLDTMKVALSGDAVIGDAPTRGSSAGVYHMVYASGLKLSGADANDYVLVADAARDYTVAKRALTLAAQRAYDGTQAFTVGDFSATGLFGSDCGSGLAACGMVGNGSVGSKNAGVMPQNLSLNADFRLLGGSVLDTNYDVNRSGITATINKRDIIAMASVDDREYDSTRNAVVKLNNYGVDGERLTLTYRQAAFDNKNAGAQKAVAVQGIELGKEDAGNYALKETTVTATASITRRPLKATATGASREYNGRYDADVRLQGDALQGDDLMLRAANAQFVTKKVGKDLAINLGDITVGGGDADNYTLVGVLPRVSGTITPRLLEITASADSRVYDGTKSVINLKLSDNRADGDQLALGDPKAEFLSKDVGEHKAIAIRGIELSGDDAKNYIVAIKGEAAITARPLNVLSLTGLHKVYDGNAKASVRTSDDHLAADAVVLNVDAAFTRKEAGSNKAIVINQIALAGDDAHNYKLSTTLPTAPVQADVTKAELVVTANAEARFYDGSTDVVGFKLGDNRIGEDKLTLTPSTVAYADKHAAVDKSITVGIKLDGDDAGNYVLKRELVEARATIKPASLTVTASSEGRDFNGQASMAVDLASNAVKGDKVVLSYQQAAADAATVGIHVVTVAGIAITGADARNYQLSNVTATTTAAIHMVAIKPDLLPLPLPSTPGGNTHGEKPVDAGKEFGGLDGSGHGGGTSKPSDPPNPDTGANNGHGHGNGVTSGPAQPDTGTSASIGGAGDDAETSGVVAGNKSNPAHPGGNEMPHNEGRHGKGGGTDDQSAVDDKRVVASGGLPAMTVATTLPARTNAVGSGHADGVDATVARVDVKVEHQPLDRLPGLVTVSIPKEMLGAQGYFRFSLPVELAQKLVEEGSEARVTLNDGQPLPTWLHYAPSGKLFIGTATPVQALPLELRVEIGAQHWAIKLTARADKQAVPAN